VQLVAGDAGAADVVDRADVRVVEGRDALGLALEARAELRVCSASSGGSSLSATSRSSRVSRRL
jgi:hypothetical protein